MKKRAHRCVLFLGPSLSGQRWSPPSDCLVCPPAAHGDVWRALSLRPRAIVLVDGVFEARPSVWHKEILAALDSGVAVFGGGSMGALRAAELSAWGMVGIGQIFRWYRDGVLVDDSEVALLHADAEHHYRPLTVPLVNVRHVAQLGQEEGVLSRRQAKQLVAAAEGIFYQTRTWSTVLAAVSSQWPGPLIERWRAFVARRPADLKALDARECIEAGLAYARASPPPAPARRSSASSLVRRRRLAAAVEQWALLPDAPRLAARGLQRLLVAGWARSYGVSPSRSDRDQALHHWKEATGLGESAHATLLAQAGLDEGELLAYLEALALEQLAMEQAPRMLSDGPSWEEGLAFEALWRGLPLGLK